jgi:hypothetical protein
VPPNCNCIAWLDLSVDQVVTCREEEATGEATLAAREELPPRAASSVAADLEMGSTPVPKGKRTKTVPATPARKSSRFHGQQAAMPVLERAQSHTAVKNLEDPGTVSVPPSSCLDGFVVLKNCQDAHLASVAHNSGLAFSHEVGSMSDILSLVRAKEEAQEALASAAFHKVELLRRAAEQDETAGADMVGVVSAQPPPDPESGPSLSQAVAPRATTRGRSTSVVASRRGRSRSGPTRWGLASGTFAGTASVGPKSLS